MSVDRSTSPVFVDQTGRRRRTVRTAATVGVGTVVAATGLLVAALLGAPVSPFSSLPPDQQPPAAVAPIPGQPQDNGATATSAHQTTTARPPSATTAAKPVGSTTEVTTDPTAAVTTTSAAGKSGHTPPGKPTDLPTPPGRTR